MSATTATSVGRGPVDPRLLRHSPAVRRQVVTSTLLGALGAGLLVAQAAVLAWVVADGFVADGFAADGTAPTLLALAGAVGAVVVGRALVDWLQQVLAERAATTVTTSLRTEVAEALVARAPGAEAVPTGRAVALLGHGVDALHPYVARFLPALGQSLVVPAVVVAATWWADPLAAVTIALTLPLVVVFMVLVGATTRDRTERRWDAMARLGHHFADLVAGRVELAVLDRDRSQSTGLRRVGERHRRATMRALRLAFCSTMVLELVATISVALVAVGVGLRVVGGGLDLRTGLFVLLLAPEAYAPLRRVGTHFHASAEGLAAAREAFALLDGAAGTSAGTRSAPDLDTAVLEVRGVSVRHPGRAGAAPAGVDLRLLPGESVALVGPSGGGKSTLLACLRGLVRPDGGRVLVGGVDVADLDPDDWARQLAWVPQHPQLVAGTVADNVRLGGAEPGDVVRSALHDAGAADLALDRWTGDTGEALSSGERRRVAVARALVRVRCRGARLLLLDEPTAGLDADTEARVLDALHGAGATLVTAAHRRAAVERCDRVLVVGRGPS